MCFEYLSLFIAIARPAETRRRLTLASRAIATAATFASAAASACGGERDLSAVVQRVSGTPSLSLSLSLSLAPTVNHSFGLSLLSRIITVSRRNRPGNGTHTQHASRRVLYSTRGVPSETNNCSALSAVFVTCLVSATVVLFLIRGRVCDNRAEFVCGCQS